MNKRLDLLGLGCGLAVAAACGAAEPARAEAAPKAQATAAPRPTRPPVGPGSLNGVWVNSAFKDYRTGPPVGAEPVVETADGQPIPWRPAARAVIEERRRRTAAGAPPSDDSCLPNGMPSMMRPPIQLPLQIIETPDQNQVTILFEFYGTFRSIYMNGKLPEDPDPALMGHSVGRWQGDTLMVETIAINPKTEIFGVPHSDQLRLVERMRRTGPETMENRITITDPETFTRPWTWVIKLKQVPGVRIMEYVCENDRNPAGADGATTVVLQSSAN